MTLDFIVKNNYGTSRYYPDDRTSRCIVKDLMNQKCLNATQVKTLKVIGGFTVNIKHTEEL